MLNHRYNQNINAYRTNIIYNNKRELIKNSNTKFLELDNVIGSIHLFNAIKATMFFILIMRVFVYLRFSLRLSFYFKAFFRILSELAGITILFILILFGFSIIISLFVGQRFYEMTSLFNTLFIAIKFIIFYGESNYLHSNSNFEKFIFIFIVFSIATAIFPLSLAIFKYVFYEEFHHYKNYKDSKWQIIFKKSGDYLDFMECFLYKNLYFIIPEYLRLRKIKNNINKKIDRKIDVDRFISQNGKI